jgi:hypothetical protein
MTIQLGGQTFTEDEIIAAIAASNDPAPTAEISTIEDLRNVLQATLTRIKALEDRLPEARVGYGVLSTTSNGVTTHRVQTLDHHGKTVIVTFEIPTT